jgi:hypothetical protein
MVGFRFIKDAPSKDVEKEVGVTEEEPVKIRVVTARYPGHVYHCDLTVVPTSSGFWVPCT